MDALQEIYIKQIICLIFSGTVILLWLFEKHHTNHNTKIGNILLLGLAICGGLAYFNFGKFHPGKYFVHHGEQFHYQLGTEYFPELGYEGLYVASLSGQLLTRPNAPLPPAIRDLRNNTFAPINTLYGHNREIMAQFSNERWEKFTADNDYYVRTIPYEYMKIIRLDHGFNGTPTWVFGAQLLTRFLPTVNIKVLRGIAAVDVLWLVVVFAAIGLTFGIRPLVLSLMVLGTGYAFRYGWVGGGLMRLDWLAFTVIGICLLKKKKYTLAGIFLGYASMLRIFPIFLLFGPFVLVMRDTLQEKKIPSWALQLASGLIVAVLAGLLLGCFTGRGWQVWIEFFNNITLHHESFTPNAVGLQNVIVYGQEIAMKFLSNPTYKMPWNIAQQEPPHMILHTAVTVCCLSLVALASWRHQVHDAALFSMFAIFSIVMVSNYYWILLILLPLKRNYGAVASLLFINFFLFYMHHTQRITFGFPKEQLLENFTATSLGFFIVFLMWLIPEALSKREKTQC